MPLAEDTNMDSVQIAIDDAFKSIAKCAKNGREYNKIDDVFRREEHTAQVLRAIRTLIDAIEVRLS